MTGDRRSNVNSICGSDLDIYTGLYEHSHSPLHSRKELPPRLINQSLSRVNGMKKTEISQDTLVVRSLARENNDVRALYAHIVMQRSHE